MKNVIVVFASLIMISATASAKDLTNRLGIGVKQNSMMDNLGELTTVYHPTKDISVSGAIGIDTKKDNSKLTFNGGVRRTIFREDNMNFYMGGIFGLVNNETAGDKKSGFQLSGVFGAEFFFPGLDSLAFSFEGGVGILSTSDVRFKTISESPVSAGVVFYF